MGSKKTSQTFTYQTRLRLDETQHEALKQCAQLFCGIERSLFAAIAAGKDSSALKSLFIKEYEITARHFNAIRVQLEGKIASIQERRKGQIEELNTKIVIVQERIAKLQKREPHSEKYHQKKRLMFNLLQRLDKLQLEEETGKIPLCFGSKQLFRAQFDLTANGYASHGEWKKEWEESRQNSFFLLGSKDEAGGNQSCTATLMENNSLNLRIRLPNCLATKYGKYLNIEGIHFQYGHQNIVAALKSCEERASLRKLKDPQSLSLGIAISYRFKYDHKGWRLFVSVPIVKGLPTTSSKDGVIGIDINADHLAVSETDRFGNPIAKRSIPLNTYGKTRNQTKALIGDTCAKLVTYAKEKGKTLVIENLDFKKKKAQLKEQADAATARMLSSLAYTQIKQHLNARAFRQGVEVAEVNPAFTSIVGRVKFSRRYGLSIHQAAALAIGRRHLKASERIPRHLEMIPDGKMGHVALSLPVRNRDKHVWHDWQILNRELKTVLAAHFRAIRKNRSSSSKPAPETVPETCR